jgi:hypothetical protein
MAEENACCSPCETDDRIESEPDGSSSSVLVRILQLSVIPNRTEQYKYFF